MLFDRAIQSGTLSQSDLAVVDYVSRHPHETLDMTSRELADAAYVSSSTVVRLCKKAGFGSFGGMKVALAQELTNEEAYEQLDADYPQLEGASVAQVIARTSSLKRQAIKRTEQLLAGVNWTPIVDALEACNSISIHGICFSMDAASVFAHDMGRLGKRVTLCEVESHSREWAAACPRDEFSIFVSYTGNSLADSAYVLMQRGLKSLAITAEGENPLMRLCSWHVPIALVGQRFAADRVAHYQDCAAQSYALDVLYSLYFSRAYTQHHKELSLMLHRQEMAVAHSLDGTVKLVAIGQRANSWIGRIENGT